MLGEARTGEGEPAVGRECGCEMEASPGKRPLRTLAGFLCANLLYWFLALTPWRLYHLVSLLLLGIVLIQLMKDMVLSRGRGAQLWRSFADSWEVIDPKSEYRLRLNQCVEERLMSFFLFLHEMAHFKEQNPGKFCLLVCSVCTFFTVLGSYVPGVVLSYFLLLGAFLCPLFTCSEFGHKLFSNMKSVLLKLDFGIRDCINQKLKERAEMIKTKLTEDDSELDISSLCPKASPEVVAKEMSVSDTDVSWTDNGTFNLSEGNTPQTDTSDDFDRPSDHEEEFAKQLSEFPSVENGAGTNDEDDSSIGLPFQQDGEKDFPPTLSSQRRARQEEEGLSAAGLSLPLLNNQAFHLVQAMATDVVTSAVSAAVRDQLQAMQAGPGLSEETDSEEGDDFELLDQSELEQIESELGLVKGQEEKKFSGFLSNLLGSH